MTTALTPSDWLRILRSEYLERFVAEGGAAVKFAIALDEGARHELDRDLRAASESLGFAFARVDAATTRVHLIDQIFFRIADQIDWSSLCARVVAALAGQKGFRPPLDGDGPLGDRLAAANGVDAKAVLMEMRPRLVDEVYKNSRLAKDFRVAMMHLCLAQLSSGSEAISTTQALTEWLTGRNKSVGAVRNFQIFNRITRTNARHLLESALAWIKLAGYPGTVVQIEIDRLSIPRNPRDDHQFYTLAMLLDAYEVLRQFIDGSDRLDACLLVVSSGAPLLDETPQGRGLGRYEALKFRVFDEVRDRDRTNPMASLIRLATEGQPGASL